MKLCFAVMCRCIGVRNEDDDEIDKTARNWRYVKFTSCVLVPNVAWLGFGLFVLLSAIEPPPTHSLTGPGTYPSSYCYRGLWVALSTAVGVSAFFVLVTIGVVVRTALSVRAFRHMTRQHESSWANHRSSSRNSSNAALRSRNGKSSYSAPRHVTADPFDTNRY